MFDWGVAGAGWATITGQILNAIYFLVCISRCKTVKLEKRHFKLQGKACGKICLLGLASFITQFALVIVIATVNNTLKITGDLSKFGPDIPVSAMGVVMKVSQIMISVVLGLSSGILPVISYNYGSGKLDRVKKLYKYAVFIGSAVMILAWLILEFFPDYIILIFGEQNALYMEFAHICMQTYMMAVFTVGFTTTTSIFFQSIDKPVQSTLLSLLRQIVILVPAVLLLGSTGKVLNVLWAGPISDGGSFLISLIVLAVYWEKIFHKEELKR